MRYLFNNKRKRKFLCYHCGNDVSDLDAYAWHIDNARRRTHPVGQKAPNPWGLYDMTGNVFEWCEDLWHTSYRGAPTDGSVWIARGDKVKRVIRGGSWGTNPEYCRSALRYWHDPGRADDDGGIRAVKRYLRCHPFHPGGIDYP